MIRAAFRQDGLSGEELEAAVLAYQIANNWPLDSAAKAEAMAEMKRSIATYVRDTAERNLK
jgi:hypothetical protein